MASWSESMEGTAYVTSAKPFRAPFDKLTQTDRANQTIEGSGGTRTNKKTNVMWLFRTTGTRLHWLWLSICPARYVPSAAGQFFLHNSCRSTSARSRFSETIEPSSVGTFPSVTSNRYYFLPHMTDRTVEPFCTGFPLDQLQADSATTVPKNKMKNPISCTRDRQKVQALGIYDPSGSCAINYLFILYSKWKKIIQEP